MDLLIKKFDELSNSQLYEILKSRAEIFLLEQNIVCQDLDDEDYNAWHFFFEEGGRVIAYLRAYYEDGDKLKIGRVLTLTHGKGIGTELMRKTLEYINANIPCSEIFVNAQKQAENFYAFLDFIPNSDEFLEEGVVHIRMKLKGE